MEFTPFIPLRSSQMILCLARTELTEVLRSLRDYIREELELDPSQWFACHLLAMKRGRFDGWWGWGWGCEAQVSRVVKTKKRLLLVALELKEVEDDVIVD